MEGWRKQQPGPEDPEERPLRVEVRECRPGHDREHEHSGRVAGRHGSRHDHLDDGEGPFVRAPMLRVGGQTGPKGGSRFGIGQMKQQQHRHARRQKARPVPAGQRGQRGDGRELGEGREGENRPHRPGRPPTRRVAPAGGARGQGKKHKDHEQDDAERLEVSAPGRLDHEQRGPGEERERPGHGAPGAAGHLGQQQAGGQVHGRPQGLEREHRPAHERARGEHHLGEGRVDGGDGGIVDAFVPDGANRFEFRRVGWVRIGVDSLELHMSVPEVAIDVVGQKRNARE